MKFIKTSIPEVKIIEPQVFSLPQGTERYVVLGSGAVLIPIEQGDFLTLRNDEGNFC